MPRSERRNCASSSGMTSSLWKPSSPATRSLHGTFPHSIPTSATSQSSAANPPGGLCSSRRNDVASNVGISATSHATVRICETEIDHGIATATPTASQSATRPRRGRSTANSVAVVVSAISISQAERHVLAAALLHSVAARGEQREQIDPPDAARVLDQNQARQQRLRRIAQERRQHEVLRALHIDL